ncbi:hypothetical protein NC652_026842 [Populus alba x Populus x berolinensis]|nr:hypothetical protein NC652_026842 [Populus alba x Populus x berolinensis]
MGISKKPYITGNFHLVLDNQRNAARQIADQLVVNLKFSGTGGCSYRHTDMLRFYHERSEDAYMDFSFTKMSWNSLEADDTNSAVLATNTIFFSVILVYIIRDSCLLKEQWKIFDGLSPSLSPILYGNPRFEIAFAMNRGRRNHIIYLRLVSYKDTAFFLFYLKSFVFLSISMTTPCVFFFFYLF